MRNQCVSKPGEVYMTVNPFLANAGSVTVRRLFVGPRPESMQLADDQILIDIKNAGRADDGGVISQVGPHLDPLL
jgi:hypothetical protein